MKNRTLTLGSLFDGAGGFPLGGFLAGIKTVWSSEVEPFPVLVTHKRMPQVKHYGDVSTLSGAELEPVDIITFGSPCQDLSVAGRRAGLQEGERSSLFFQAIRIIKEMRNKRYCAMVARTIMDSYYALNVKNLPDEMKEMKKDFIEFYWAHKEQYQAIDLKSLREIKEVSRKEYQRGIDEESERRDIDRDREIVDESISVTKWLKSLDGEV